ncbi:methyltransferase [Halomicrobium zhouii]|uniref:tRNA(Phe) (4-demethylwyosine(37)-C(7)) aminocarboxypropyltransferase n=1 Tax=Halomicrobium zhouii TaxID=767519 RepID=A0A1I6K294_9EURY|nr:class I SAM-dependent methyltransferase family protein [Halomicrobium zhouii]SFR85297.1 methyltransferase [Halomicrobium zhouii]
MADSADQDLAAVVPKSRSQRVIDALESEGVYDDDRHVREWTDDAVAIPVTEPPESVDYLEIVRQVGEPRLRTLEDYLREMGWTDDELDLAPGSWAVVGSVVLVELGDAPRPNEVGEALLSLHGEADTVLSRGPITGEHREPAVEVVAGTGDTETIHHEHGTAYALDLAEVMFSPGNQAERTRMGDVVREGTERTERASGSERSERHASSEDERVLDMFAGVGYFTLPMARAGAEVTAVERNPDSFRYLVENAMLNDVGDRVHPYRADCRDVVEEFANEAPADRVVMGYYDATEPDGDSGYEYLDAALTALAPGGTIHVHEATPNDLVFDRPIERLRDAAATVDREVEVLETREVKSYSEGVAHVVVDAHVD